MNVTCKAHTSEQVQWAAIDSGASGNYYLASYCGSQHDPLVTKIVVGCANDELIKSTAKDTIKFKKLPWKIKLIPFIDHIRMTSLTRTIYHGTTDQPL